MGRYYGKVGYVKSAQAARGVYLDDEVIERYYSGKVISLSSRWVERGSANGDIVLNSEFSIIADPYAYENFTYIKYIEYKGVKWSVTNVNASNRPRLLLSVGGIYSESN